MTISPSTSRAFENITARQQDLRSAFTPGASASHSDVARERTSRFTLDPLAAAAPAGAYFIGLDERGRRTYTRDGVFHVRDNVLVDRYDRPVLGFSGKDRSLGTLRVDPVDSALGRTADIAIGSDGSVSYARTAIDPRTGKREAVRVVVGNLALAKFAAATKLQPLDATRSLAPEQTTPHIGTANDGNFGAVTPHREESSAIDFDRGIAQLQEAYLAFDALRAAHGAQGNVEKSAMDLVK